MEIHLSHYDIWPSERFALSFTREQMFLEESLMQQFNSPVSFYCERLECGIQSWKSHVCLCWSARSSHGKLQKHLLRKHDSLVCKSFVRDLHLRVRQEM